MTILISIIRIIGYAFIHVIQIWELLFIIPIIIAVANEILMRFIHYKIRTAICKIQFSLADIIFIYFTNQLGQYPGLFYLSQILVVHAKDCERTNCFCQQKHELNAEQTWKAESETLLISLNRVMSEILRLYNFKELKDNKEYILLLSRIEAEYRDDRLFETLIRSKKLEDDNQMIKYKFFPSQIRINGHRQKFYSKLLDKIKGVSINSFIYFTYCNLVEQVGQMVMQLLSFRQQIFIMLTIQYQNPLYYLFDYKMKSYIDLFKKSEKLLNQITQQNPFSEVSKHLVYAMYNMVSFQQEKFQKIKDYHLTTQKIDQLWDTLNDRQCCYVQCKYDNGLILFNHSVLFTKIVEESNNKSEYLGQFIDDLIAGPAKDVHSRFINRLINEGKPRLLNNGIQKFYINTNKGFMKQIDSLVRLGQSMQYLTFMTIMGYKQEDSCGKILLSLDGKMYSYCEIAMKLLKFEQIKLKIKTERLHINLKLCMPSLNNYNELETGLIIIPKVRLMSAKQHISKTISTKSIDQIAFYKYFLQHPKQCLVFVSTYKICESNYDDGNLKFETLYLYFCKEIKDIELKMISLEIMLKQMMLIHNVYSESYATTYTSFKSIIPGQIKQSMSEKTSSQPDIHNKTNEFEVDDNQFILSNESVHIQQDPQTFFVTPFINSDQQLQQQQSYQEVHEQECKIINGNQSSIIGNSNSFQTDILLSKRGLEDLSARDTARENQKLLQSNFNTNQILITQLQKQVNDEIEDLESPEETKNLQELSVNIKDMTEIQLKEQIEWIKSEVKKAKQISDNIIRSLSIIRKNQRKKLTLDYQQSQSIKSTDSSRGLLNHVVDGMIDSTPYQFYSLILISLLYFAVLIIIIVLSFINAQNALQSTLLDTYGIKYSVSLLQNINLISIAIPIMSYQCNLIPLMYYIQNSTQDYINITQSINNLQNINYQFLQEIEDDKIIIKYESYDQSSIIKSYNYQARYFYVDQLIQIFQELQINLNQNISSININNLYESYIVLNYPIYFNSSVYLLAQAKQNIEQSQNYLENLIKIFIGIGISSCTVISLSFFYGQIQILKWRSRIVRTYYLFQNLNLSLEEQDKDVVRLLQTDEMKHMKYNQLKPDKVGILSLKQQQRSQDDIIRRKFFIRQCILLFLMISLSLIYFLPYQFLLQEQLVVLSKFQNSITQLGYSQLSFSTYFTYFILSYFNSDNNIDNITFSNFYENAYQYENSFVYSLSFDEDSDIQKITDFVNEDLCQIAINEAVNIQNYECPYILEKGYSNFLIQALNQLSLWQNEFSQGIDVINLLEDQNLQVLLIQYAYIFPIFNLRRELAFQLQNNTNNQSTNQSKAIMIVIILIIFFVFSIIFFLIGKQFYLIINTTKKALLLFSRETILKNKHLVQVLSKEVTLE